MRHGANFTARDNGPATGRQNAVQLTYFWKQIDTHANVPARAKWKPASVSFAYWNDEAGTTSGFPEQRTFQRTFLLFETTIDAGTVQAFWETEYRVHGHETFTLKVGEVCPALDAVHKRHRVDCSAYITACNPFSQILDDEANAERHAALGREINQRSLASIEGIGQHPSNQWPGEASHLIFGLTLEAAKTLGTRLEQNAIVWSGADAVPQLILLR